MDNVAWTNVEETVRICSRCSQECSFKSSVKIGLVTVEILLPKSLCGAGGWWWVVVVGGGGGCVNLF